MGVSNFSGSGPGTTPRFWIPRPQHLDHIHLYQSRDRILPFIQRSEFVDAPLTPSSHTQPSLTCVIFFFPIHAAHFVSMRGCESCTPCISKLENFASSHPFERLMHVRPPTRFVSAFLILFSALSAACFEIASTHTGHDQNN